MRKITFFLAVTAFIMSNDGVSQIYEDFETAPPAGWTFYETDSLDPGFLQSTTAHNGNASFYHNDDQLDSTSTAWMVSPAYTCGSNDELKFWYQQNYTASYYYYSGVWISTSSNDPINNPGDFTELIELDSMAPGGFSEDVWTEYIHNLSTYNGSTIYIAFKYQGDFSHELYIDDFSLDMVPTCPWPTDLSTSMITSSSANLNWTENGSANLWEIEYDTAGFLQGTGMINTTPTNPFNLTGLNENTTYDFYVRAICGIGDSSYWSGPYSFSTLCNSFNTPFTEGFNSNSTTENCWTIIDNNNDGDMWNMNYTTNPFEGDEVAVLNTDFNSGFDDDFLVSPSIILSGNEELRFQYRAQSTAEPNNFEVLLSTTGNMPADFTDTLLVDTANNDSFMLQNINLSAYSGAVHIAFHVPSGGLDGWILYIDDVVIDVPTNLLLHSNDKFSIFPNPNRGLFSVNNVEEQSLLEVFSLQGKKVYSKVISNGSSKIDLQDKPNGLYIVTLSTSSTSESYKLIIE